MNKTLQQNVANDLAKLYEEDETAWLDRSVELIKKGRQAELDYPNLIDFLESMANRDRREVKSRLATLMAHVLKWQYQPECRTRSWRRTIINEHQELEFDFQSKTLRNHAEEILGEIYLRAVKSAAAETRLSPDVFPRECPFTVDFLTGDDVLKLVAQD